MASVSAAGIQSSPPGTGARLHLRVQRLAAVFLATHRSVASPESVYFALHAARSDMLGIGGRAAGLYRAWRTPHSARDRRVPHSRRRQGGSARYWCRSASVAQSAPTSWLPDYREPMSHPSTSTVRVLTPNVRNRKTHSRQFNAEHRRRSCGIIPRCDIGAALGLA
jgi:hypothetical protein